jgi:hypothetical protein
MTPKQKAKELVHKYEYLVDTWDCYNDEPLELEFKLPKMTQCALIAVDEIIKVLVELSEGKFTFIHNVEYWQEVKTEIEKL